MPLPFWRLSTVSEKRMRSASADEKKLFMVSSVNDEAGVAEGEDRDRGKSR